MKIMSFDFIGKHPQFYINNTTKHKSNLGGILSIFISILSILCFIVIGFSLDLFQRKRPELFSSDELNYDKIVEVKQMMLAICPMLFDVG